MYLYTWRQNYLKIQIFRSAAVLINSSQYCLQDLYREPERMQIRLSSVAAVICDRYEKFVSFVKKKLVS